MENKVVFLEGEKIYLRPPELTDVPQLTRWANDGEMTKYLTLRYPMNSIVEENWVKKQAENQEIFTLMIVVKEEDLPIGVVSLHDIHPINRNAVLGIMIGEKDYWGNGYGSEAVKLVTGYAFNYLNLYKVSLTVYAFNKRAQKAYEKCGFKANGVKPEDVFVDGKYYDVILMSLLRKDFG